MNLKNLLVLLIILLGIGCPVAFGEIIYVDKDAPGPTHNGSSWGRLFYFCRTL
jgi:hypothetical protein